MDLSIHFIGVKMSYLVFQILGVAGGTVVSRLYLEEDEGCKYITCCTAALSHLASTLGVKNFVVM